MTISSLASTIDRTVVQLRPSSTQDNWGGDETVALTVIDSALPCRVEWGEGVSDKWDIWSFTPDANIQDHDILLVDDDDLELALIVMRVSSFTRLRGDFHHWEILTNEHEQTVAQLKAAAGI